MGYGKKNTNRGEAIARNTERVRSMEKEFGIVRRIVHVDQEAHKIEFDDIRRRLALLERPIHRKALDWIRDRYQRIREAIRKPKTGTTITIDTAGQVREPGDDQDVEPGIEIVGKSVPLIVDEELARLEQVIEENAIEPTKGNDDGNEKTETGP